SRANCRTIRSRRRRSRLRRRTAAGWSAQSDSARDAAPRSGTGRRRRSSRRKYPAAGGLRRLFGELFGLDALGARHERRLQVLLDRLLRNDALGDVATRRELEHDVEQSVFDDRTEPARAGFALERLVGDLPQRVLGEHELDRVVTEEALVLPHERVLRLGQDLDEILALQLMHSGDDREAADELGDEPEVQEVLRHDVAKQLGGLDRMLRTHFSAEADGTLADSPADDLVQPGERAAADEQDVRRVDRQEFLMR